MRTRVGAPANSATKAKLTPMAEARCRTSDWKNTAPVLRAVPSTIARRAATSSRSRSAPQAGSGSGTAWSPVTAGWRSRDEPGGGVAVDSFAPSLTLVLPIGDDTVGNTQIHRNG